MKKISSISLWAARLDDDTPLLLDLGVTNVIHFADWGAGLSVVGYSTVEPRSTAPGWQANNDLSYHWGESFGLCFSRQT